MSDSKTTDKYTAMSFEAMYGADESEPDGRPLELDIDTLHPFPNQPFRPYKEDEMDKMVESIQENGVISPIVVRPKEDGAYEIISGHNRVEACRRAGITQIPSFIREVDDDTAVILMVDSNLRQREKLSDIEKAKAYEMKLDAIKHQGERTDLTCGQLDHKLTGSKSRDIIAEQSNDSPRQIQRYIRLAGVKFGIYKDANCSQKVTEVTTGNDGTVTVSNLDAGTYYVKELSTVRPYVVDGLVHSVIVVVSETTTLELENETAKGAIRVLKTAYVLTGTTASNTEYGQLHSPKYEVKGLPGCVFEVKNASGTVVATLTTDETGTAETPLLPFGTYTVQETATVTGYDLDASIYTVTLAYKDQNTPIHDYFFAKALDKVRPGGVVAFITSSGTMDKANPAVRKYLAQRAELLGAIRLPNNAFRANAGTDVVADILFLQKRDHPIEIDEDWLHIGKSELGYPINEYFLKNPDMILGELTEESTRFGMGQTVKPIEGADLNEQLRDAIANIHGEIVALEQEDELEGTAKATLPADPDVRNFSFTLVDGEIYFRENSIMTKIEVSLTAQNRIKGMIAIRDCAHKLIDRQLNDYSDAAIAETQRELNTFYDAYTAKYGLLNSRGNSMAFSDDSSYPLLCSLEVLDENGKLERKADMFYKRTVRQYTEITHVDTAAEALTVSLSEKAKVDLPYMAGLTGKSEDALEAELTGLVFRDIGTYYEGFYNPDTFDLKAFPLVTADAFLSGNVRSKLNTFRTVQEKLQNAGKAEEAGALSVSIAALEKVQPKDLDASEINVRLGATWIPEEDVKAFIFDTLQPGWRAQRYVQVHYFDITGEWRIEGKNTDYGNVTANVTYGTNRINAYEIIEDSLNLKDVRIYDTVTDDDGREKRVLNMKQTILAQQKQTLLQEAFRDWLWKDPQRRDRLVTMYNERFNSTRPREYDGNHLVFPGMNPEITLRPHQANAIARVLYGGNTLLAHVVGAGKTFEMTAAAMELKRLGLCHKSLFVVPNHLTEQWASEFLQLYPSANILVATKKDFEKQNRRR